MASSFFISLCFVLMVPLLVSSYEFEVGGKEGWAKPSAKDPDTYNDWAAKNRFHVGDAINFKYQKDSVLVVNQSDYESCTTVNPISKFEDGDTVFQFDRYGFFYFISGQPGNCDSGQRMIIRVMVHPEVQTPESTAAPPPKAEEDGKHHWWDSDNFGPPGIISASSVVSAASCIMTGLVAVFVVFCLFV